MLASAETADARMQPIADAVPQRVATAPTLRQRVAAHLMVPPMLQRRAAAYLMVPPMPQRRAVAPLTVADRMGAASATSLGT